MEDATKAEYKMSIEGKEEAPMDGKEDEDKSSSNLEEKALNIITPAPQTKKKKKAKRAIKYCKAPQAPKRFKSAFIFFTMARHGEIRKKLESEGAADKVSYLLVLWQFHS